MDEVELLQANPQYAHVRYPDGRETTVATKHLAPRGEPKATLLEQEKVPTSTCEITPPIEVAPVLTPDSVTAQLQTPGAETQPLLRRSERVRRVPERLSYE